MKSNNFYFSENNWVGIDEATTNLGNSQIVLVFGEKGKLKDESLFNKINHSFPNADIIRCSTAGEINNSTSLDNSLVCVPILFEKTPISLSIANISSCANSHELGKKVAEALPQENLKYILIISDGNLVNGDALLKGIYETIDSSVIVTGGLAGDGANFHSTYVGLNENIAEGNVVLMGLYGDHIIIGSGINGGWDVFGPERTITSASENTLIELDNTNALDFYKKYLGKYADDLPGSALLFPLSIRHEENNYSVVRTILSIDETNKTMTFAGNMPIGAKARLMKTNFDKLILSVPDAARYALVNFKEQVPSLALIISCVGRKMVLGSRMDEELEAATEIFDKNTTIAGFFSYGEISPVMGHVSDCSQLHNQTFTITTFTELV